METQCSKSMDTLVDVWLGQKGPRSKPVHWEKRDFIKIAIGATGHFYEGGDFQ